MCSRCVIPALCFLLLFTATASRADDTPADSVPVELADSLHPPIQNGAKPPKPFVPRFSFHDSLAARLLSSRLDLNEQVTAGMPRNPGDYLRGEPSQFLITYAQAAVRTTVSPFGLSGNRLSAIEAGIPFSPFEHFLQPDGAADMNDIPALADDHIYLLAGQTGQLFGGDHAAATLMTRPEPPSDSRAHTAMLVNRGVFGYSDIRGRYRKRFDSGRDLLLGLGYRSSDGNFFDTQDDSYHYIASYVEPINSQLSFSVDGALYDRRGAYRLLPDFSEDFVNRERFDRSVRAGLNVQNETGSRRAEAGYKHRRQGSAIGNPYRTNFNLIANGGYLTLEGIRRQITYRLEFNAEQEKWWDGVIERDRLNGELFATALTSLNSFDLSLQAGGRYAEDFDFLPAVTAALSFKSSLLYLLASVGYSERAPSLHELNHRYRNIPFTAPGYDRYADEGNPALKSERQMIGTVTAVFGTENSSATAMIAGGKLTDAIDWAQSLVSDSSGNNSYFHPINHDVDFTSASLTLRQKLFRSFSLQAGGAVFHYASDSLPERLYRPDYNFFSSGELHVYWAHTGVDLYAYGELMFTGLYDGYNAQDLGENLLANAKFSLGMRRFRIFYSIENIFITEFETREFYTNESRTGFLSFTWYFVD